MSKNAIDCSDHDHRIVRELLDERRQLWSLFTSLGKLGSFAPGQLQGRLQEFCQVLVDYISLGHFEMYPRLTEGQERRATVQALANSLYSSFVEATDAAVEFNDKCESLAWNPSRAELEADLSRLGAALNVRFKLEDQLIGAMGA